MIALDTNVVVRFLVQDDIEQGQAAARLIETCTETSPGFIGREVMVEIVWVLQRAYKLPREQVAAALDGLLGAQEIVVEQADRVARAVHRYREEGYDFADLMIVAAALSAECKALYTFDRKAARIDGVSEVKL